MNAAENATATLESDAADREGMAIVEGLRDGSRTPPAIIDLMPARVHACSLGKIELRAAVGEQHYNGLGMAHGGWAMITQGMAMGLIALTVLPLGFTRPSSDVSVRFFRPIGTNLGEVRIIASVVSETRRIVTVESRVEDGSAQYLALATGSFVSTVSSALFDRAQDEASSPKAPRP